MPKIYFSTFSCKTWAEKKVVCSSRYIVRGEMPAESSPLKCFRFVKMRKILRKFIQVKGSQKGTHKHKKHSWYSFDGITRNTLYASWDYDVNVSLRFLVVVIPCNPFYISFHILMFFQPLKNSRIDDAGIKHATLLMFLRIYGSKEPFTAYLA